MTNAHQVAAHFILYRLARARGKGYAYFRCVGATPSFGTYPCLPS